MEPEPATIPVRSRRQAMDWSLVLVSQGIETTIEYDETAGWRLTLAAEQVQPALEALRRYKLENRRWPWQREVLPPGFLFDWASLAWLALLLLFFWLDLRKDLRPAGWMLRLAVTQGQWWRLFTAVWLHADAGHLASNASFGIILLGLAMARYGTGAGLLAAYLAGAGGNVARWLLPGDTNPSLGASGMVMGSLGLLAIQSFWLWRRTPHATKVMLTGLLGGLMLFVLLGLGPGTDIVAHAGGFASGLLLGAVLSLVPKLAQRPKLNLVSGLLFAVLVVMPWWLALRHIR